MWRLAWSTVLLVQTAIPQMPPYSRDQRLDNMGPNAQMREVREAMTAARAPAEEDSRYAPRPTFRRWRAVGGPGQVSEIVALVDRDPNAVIHYTLDGSKPTLQSPVYSRPLAVPGTLRVRALAEITGLKPSDEVRKRFVLGK